MAELCETLKFSEKRGTCLGYGAESISGAGFGQEKTLNLITNAKAAIELGIKNPNLFLVLSIFEKNVGPDLISDMVTNIIYEDLCRITEDFVSKLDIDIPTHSFNIKSQKFNLPVNRLSSRPVPVILIPEDILRDLPVATDHEGVSAAASYNSQLRDKVSKQVGGDMEVKKAERQGFKIRCTFKR